MALFSRKGPDLGPPVHFTFVVADAFHIPPKSFVFTGTVVDGQVQRGQQATVDFPSGARQVTIKAIDRGGKLVPHAEHGAEVGLYLDGIAPSDLPLGPGNDGAGQRDYALSQVVVRG